jgi:hypothetical protein
MDESEARHQEIITRAEVAGFSPRFVSGEKENVDEPGWVFLRHGNKNLMVRWYAASNVPITIVLDWLDRFPE